jgi:hypothetical protein
VRAAVFTGAMVAKTHNPVVTLREIALLLDAYDINPLTSSRSQNRARLPRRAFCDGLQALSSQFPTREHASMRKKHDRNGKR